MITFLNHQSFAGQAVSPPPIKAIPPKALAFPIPLRHRLGFALHLPRQVERGEGQGGERVEKSGRRSRGVVGAASSPPEQEGDRRGSYCRRIASSRRTTTSPTPQPCRHATLRRALHHLLRRVSHHCALLPKFRPTLPWTPSCLAPGATLCRSFSTPGHTHALTYMA